MRRKKTPPPAVVVEERRCNAGQPTEPTDCDRHPKHYWCEWCEGWFGVPHDYGCHTAAVRQDKRIPNVGRPQPGQCACLYCRVVHRHGYAFAENLLRKK